MTINSNRIPYIPKRTPDSRPMQYYYFEDDTTAKTVPYSEFLHLVKKQEHPMAQVNIDLEGGYAYLLPYCPERAEYFIQMNRELDASRKRYNRRKQEIDDKKRQPDLHLDYPLNEDGLTFGDTLPDADTPESLLSKKEHFIIHRESFNALKDSDRDILTDFINAGCNASELARRLGKDHSGVLKHVKRAATRLQKIIEENS